MKIDNRYKIFFIVCVLLLFFAFFYKLFHPNFNRKGPVERTFKKISYSKPSVIVRRIKGKGKNSNDATKYFIKISSVDDLIREGLMLEGDLILKGQIFDAHGNLFQGYATVFIVKCLKKKPKFIKESNDISPEEARFIQKTISRIKYDALQLEQYLYFRWRCSAHIDDLLRTYRYYYFVGREEVVIEGKFTIKKLPQGDFFLVVFAYSSKSSNTNCDACKETTPFATPTIYYVEKFTINKFNSPLLKNVYLPPTGCIEGIVKNAETSEPVSHAEIGIKGKELRPYLLRYIMNIGLYSEDFDYISSCENGHFYIGGLMPRNSSYRWKILGEDFEYVDKELWAQIETGYHIYVSDPLYHSKCVKVEVNPGMTTYIEVKLKPKTEEELKKERSKYTIITGALINREGEPIKHAYAYVHGYYKKKDGTWQEYCSFFDSGFGEYELYMPSSKAYKDAPSYTGEIGIHVLKEGYQEKFLTVKLPVEPQNYRLDIVLDAPAYEVKGILLSKKTGQPISDRYVCLISPEGMYFGAQTDKEGRFQFPVLLARKKYSFEVQKNPREDKFIKLMDVIPPANIVAYIDD